MVDKKEVGEILIPVAEALVEALVVAVVVVVSEDSAVVVSAAAERGGVGSWMLDISC